MRPFEHLGEALRLLRALAGKTRAQLARAVGVGTQQIGKYETGQQRPDLDGLGRLLDELEVGLPAFVGLLEAIGRAQQGAVEVPPVVLPPIEEALTQLVTEAARLAGVAQEVVVRAELKRRR